MISILLQIFLIFLLCQLVASISNVNNNEAIISIVPANFSNSLHQQSHLRINRSAKSSASHYPNHESSRFLTSQRFIDLSQIISSAFHHELLKELYVQLTNDYKPTLFTRKFSAIDKDGYYWYGETDSEDSYFSIQVHGENCIG